ncbi:ATPase, partial [Rhizobiaceae sp. 2RAB30]
VTQRPGELDPTVLSQCSTVFAMRLANEQDQAIIRSAIADSSASTLSFLSSMGQREAIAFGEGVATTMRLKFEKLDPAFIPGAAGKGDDEEPTTEGEIDLATIVDRLRNVPRPIQSSSMFGDPVSAVRQAGDQAPSLSQPGDADERPPVPPRRDDDDDFGYGLRPSTFGLRPQRS